MANSRITIHPKFQIGEISTRLFSAFLEPIGTMVNGFMYNPKHPTADSQGFRTDVINKITHYESYSKDFDKKSSFEAEWGQPESNPAASLKDGIAATKTKALSWNVIVFEV